MYLFLWRRLPGDTVTKGLVAAAIALVLIAILWYLAFPWIEPQIRYDHSTVENGENAPVPNPSPGR